MKNDDFIVRAFCYTMSFVSLIMIFSAVFGFM